MAITNRRDLEKELAKARKDFMKAKADYDTYHVQLEALQAKTTDAEQRMSASRKIIMDISNYIQTMDLTGADAVKDRGDIKTYIMNGKEYHAEKDNNDVRLTPWKEYKKHDGKEENDCMIDTNNISDSYQAVMDMLR